MTSDIAPPELKKSASAGRDAPDLKKEAGAQLFITPEEENLRKLRIRYIVPGKDGCSWYRLELPASGLAILGFDVGIVYGTRNAMESPAMFRSSLLDDADVIVLQRPTVFFLSDSTFFPVSESILNARKAGKAVVVDNDDLIMDIPKGNPAASVYNHREVLLSHLHACRSASVCTFSTPELARAYHRYAQVTRSWIYPNLLPYGIAPPDQEKEDRFTVLVTGSVSHRVDWEPLFAAIVDFFNYAGDRARLMVQGYNPRRWKDYDPFSLVISSWMEALPSELVEYIPWSDYETYIRNMARAHVVVNWLKENEFNSCKSEIKAKEAALAGCLFVGPMSPCYVRWYRANPDMCRIVPSSKMLSSTLIELLHSYYEGKFPEFSVLQKRALKYRWNREQLLGLMKIYEAAANIAKSEMVFPLREST